MGGAPEKSSQRTCGVVEGVILVMWRKSRSLLCELSLKRSQMVDQTQVSDTDFQIIINQILYRASGELGITKQHRHK